MAGESSTPVRVLVVAYHADDDLRRCLAALNHPSAVTVVDNAVSPLTRRIALDAGVDYLPSPGNPGYAAGVNRGLAHVGAGNDILLLNPDAEISWPDVLTLQAAMRAGGARLAAVGPRLVGLDGAPQRASWPLPSPGQVWTDALGLSRFWRGRSFVTGAVLLLHADALRELGGLDERYFLYVEEADWQRAAQDAGWGVAVIVSVTAVHAGATSSTDPIVRAGHADAGGAKYARKWFGPAGVALMSAGSMVGAARRSVVRRRPVPGAQARSVLHVVRSDGFAGVERYIADVAAETAAIGWNVTVIGGDPVRMRAALPESVAHEPAASVVQVIGALGRHRDTAVVHAHMTAAELPAAVFKRRGARLVVTRHFAARRGSTLPARLLGRALRGRIDVQLAVSEFVAARIGEPSVVLHNGVRRGDRSGPGQRDTVVVVLQRLEREKDTVTAIRAWAESGLAAQGWRMEVFGQGADETSLRAAAGPGVTFRGYTDDPRSALAGAAALLATAPAEPFGLSVVEAMAEGTPVIAARGGAHEETLGTLGRFFPPGDVHAAARALCALAADPDADQDGARLRARFDAHFTVARHVQRLVEHYADPRSVR